MPTMNISLPQLVRHFSQGMVLEPGAAIFTGTFAGVAPGVEGSPHLPVVVEIDGLGRQRQWFIAP